MVGGAYPSYTTSTVKKGIASPQHSNQLSIGGNAPNTPGSGGGISAEMTFTSFFMGLMIEKWTSVITENFLQRPALVSKQAVKLEYTLGQLFEPLSIANRTDNVPHLLIGVDMFIHWMDNIGAKGVPFPNWYNCLFPSLDAISGHPWLLTVKWCDMGASNTVSIDKGKGKVVPGEPEAMHREVASRHDVNDDGESEVGEMELEVDKDISEPAWSTRQKSQLQATQAGRKDVEGQDEAHTPKAPTRCQATPMWHNPSHQQKQPAQLTNDDMPAPPLQKKVCVSQGGQASQSGTATMSSSAPPE
ncbi:hypothetical protein EDC04DRAFT_2604940 [Pisolithus marmoratus]|nr:hypothetical protein EDC04DRAFT_2604940 [Pisolithus marmoratus]